ncbi:MAG: hypothetical protein K2H90_07890 [Oscillospiraceae bacterium]|nr:hypothetical protein [Oscillospiraceae bacterium]
MKAEFRYTQITDNLLVISLLAMFLTVLVLCFLAVLFLLLASVAAWGVIMFVIYWAFSGELIADEKGVTAVTMLFGKKIKEKFIEYSDINYTDCGVSTYRRGGCGIFYSMYFTIKKKNGSKITVSNRLNISSRLPTNEPDKYKQYIHNQPLMKISHYIDSKLHLDTSA